MKNADASQVTFQHPVMTDSNTCGTNTPSPRCRLRRQNLSFSLKAAHAHGTGTRRCLSTGGMDVGKLIDRNDNNDEDPPASRTNLEVNFKFGDEDVEDSVSADEDSEAEQAAVPVQDRHDFRYLVAGACLLTAASGYTNAIAVLSIGKTATHATGATTYTGIHIVSGQYQAVMQAVAMLLSFLSGSIIWSAFGGYGSERFVLKPRYGVFLVGGGCLLSIGLWSVSAGHGTAGGCVMSFCSGVQNALCTSFSGAVIRTTHVTGMLTDIGISIGHYLHGFFTNTLTTSPPPDTWKLRILLPQYASYLTGAFLAALFFSLVGITAGYLVSCSLTLAGMAYIFASSKGHFDTLVEEELEEQEIEEMERRFSVALHTALHTGVGSGRGSFIRS